MYNTPVIINLVQTRDEGNTYEIFNISWQHKIEKQEFNFDEDSFNELFPFYFLIDSDLKINGIGKSLAKALPSIKLHDNFASSFTVKRPYVETSTFENLVTVHNQLVVIITALETIDLRGQFQEHNGFILFVGSPWFVSMDRGY
ncbi:MAG: hypothetical protein ACI9M1_002584 [Porticoccaceae bacterium]|jgi:hypothetical protein